MRTPKPRRRKVRNETIIFTGGLNETVTSLELDKGELHSCINYVETDGDYHGYASIQGYEVYDGKTKPSDIPAPIVVDSVNDADTVCLIEAENVEDLSRIMHLVVNEGAIINESQFKFPFGSYDMQHGYLQVASSNLGEFDSAYSSAFYQEDLASRSYLNLINDWTIDLQVRTRVPMVAEQTIFEKATCYKLTLAIDGTLTFHISSDGITYDHTLTQTAPMLSRAFTHVSIRVKDNVLKMAYNGEVQPNELTIPAIHQSIEDLYIGDSFSTDSPFLGYFDEFRISTVFRWTADFTAPIARYSIGEPSYTWDDEAREAQRESITEVPGIGNLLGIHIYESEVYALRNINGVNAALYKAVETGDDLTAGWTLIDDTFTVSGSLDAHNERFSGNFGDQRVMIMCDGVSVPRVWDGMTMTLLTDLTLPDNQVGTPRFAKKISVFDGRILLGYHEDDMFLSAKDVVTNFSGGFGTQLLIGDSITNFKELPGEALAVICANSIKILTKLTSANSTASSPDYTFKVENFSKQSGGIEFSAERMLNKNVYADSRGIVTLEATDKFGDFSASAISKKVNRIYLAKRKLITCSMIDREHNQYRIFFSDGTGLIFTFREEPDRDGDVLKGATYVVYDKPIIRTAEGKDSNGKYIRYFITEDGFVYQMDSGTSFNGSEIPTKFSSSFYGYGSSRYWKQFHRMIFELTASLGTIFKVRNVFDYDESQFPNTLTYDAIPRGNGGIFGQDNWGEFLWGGAVVERFINYIRGHGTNMSIELATSSKHAAQHVVHNCIVDFQVENIQE